MPIRGVAGDLMTSKSLRFKPNSRRGKKRKAIKAHRVRKRIATPIGERVRNFQIYALELEGGNYYVGITAYKDVTRRFNQHLDGKGAKWTRLHKPIRVIATRDIGLISESAAVRQETAFTIAYIKQYGMYQVRGGALCRVDPKQHASSFNALSTVTTTRSSVQC
jgi:predicted GIY-YIG superfamily endonuclease